ncbi:MAG: hypothetical protein IKI31_04640, partial [Treponema sp.]|nr:hypothetical protein [Treponema sp.]
MSIPKDKFFGFESSTRETIFSFESAFKSETSKRHEPIVFSFTFKINFASPVKVENLSEYKTESKRAPCFVMSPEIKNLGANENASPLSSPSKRDKCNANPS